MYVNARAIIERKRGSEIEILVQMRDKPNQPKALELPGGRIEEYESIQDALHREVFEETGLKIKEIIQGTNQKVYSNNGTTIEGLIPFFVYQTIQGPVDSIGFIFRCEVEEGELTANDEASGHQWMCISDVQRLFENAPDSFDFLTHGLLNYYLEWIKLNCNEIKV
ncbi:NUDIX hydrolase [Pseudalkalibacillus sp. R45]|uniref:NUDIX hydrolase n=1 Tax=Pseudalkalibacillus sp. R45 TaxID=3457433 RepID=UPI003FCC7C80